ncbi:MAG: hypothetical protein OXC26_24960 [Albidovulum sp.]|nr:hypothetical protein [Albidovulum sp.]
MTIDEQLQVKKDTLLDIHETVKTNACLERQVDASIEAMQSVIAAWDKGGLGSVSGNLVLRKTEQTPNTLKKYADPATLAALVKELEESKARHKKLEDSLSRM